MKRITLMFFILCFFLISACSPQPIPAATPTQAPTPTTASQPFTGNLFFDMNGSGLQDESSFIYDPERLADPRQPLQPDLDKAIKDYVAAHPNLKNGDLATLPEPGLSGYKVCIDQQCATTSSDGSFSISNKTAGTTALLKMTDPYAEKPAYAMRYFNEWKRIVTIPTYEVKNVKIPEQRLNDTVIIPITKSIYIQSGQDKAIGLMQGFLTSPFEKKDSPNIYIWGFWDDANNYITCGKPAKPNGIAISYDGKYTRDGGGNPIRPSIGVGDGHDGYDYSVPVSTRIYNGGPNGEVWLLPKEGELRVLTNYPVGENHFQNCYAHLSVQLVKMEPVYRGQIVGLSGHSGDSPYHQLHFDLTKSVKVGSKMCNQYVDPYRSIIEAPFPKDYSGSNVSYWTVDNLPQFPLVGE